jgi:hypothetical protein
MKLRAGDLDAVSLAYLDGWARSLAKLDLFDAAELDRDQREYFCALNSARLWMGRLEDRLRKLGMDRGKRPDALAVLAAHGQRIRTARNGDAGE